MKPSVVIDCFPHSVDRYRRGYAVVAIDIIRATTMAITAVAVGRRCLVAGSLSEAQHIASQFVDPLLAGELGGDMPTGFEMNNSPAKLVRRKDLDRPMVLLSTAGSQLMCAAGRCEEQGYLACFRNYAAVARHLAGRHEHIAIIGAGSRNEFREEDQMCCAWIAESLVNAGYMAESRSTMEVIERWSGMPPSSCSVSNSVGYLRRSGQLQDLDFILAHINDLDCAYTVSGNEVLAVGPAHVLEIGMKAA